MIIEIREKIFNFIDAVFDTLYGVKTNGYLLNINNRNIYLGYGPTYYIYLHKLFKKYSFNQEDYFVDFGCGKGRVILMANKYKCKRITAIDINENMIKIAKKNTEKFHETLNIQLCKAEELVITESMNKFYFYNPFHIKIFIKLINNILKICKHKAYIFLFYAKKPYIDFLDTVKQVKLYEIMKGTLNTEYNRVYFISGYENGN